MNESWRQAEADAHEAKADAIRAAIEMLDGLNGALDTILDGQVKPVREMLAHTLQKHERAAKLGRDEH